MKFPIFMDNHSTTPMDPRVLEAMLPYFIEKFGNAASRNHQLGWEAEEAVENARKQIAKRINCDAKEIVFTSGATESDNLALKGIVEMYKEKGDHVITCMTEHRAVLDTCKSLEKRGIKVTYLPVAKDGLVSPDDVQSHYGQDHPDFDHGGQQRDWRDPPRRRDREDRQGEGHPLPLRRHTGRRQDPGGRRSAQGGPDVLHRPQDLRTERRRGPVRAEKRPAGALGAPDRRGRPRARDAVRHPARTPR